METFSLRVVVPPAEVGTVPLPLESGSCCVHLRCLEGASGAHLVFVDGDGRAVLRAEVKAAGGETLEVQVTAGADGNLRVQSQERRVYTLPRDSHYAPLPPIPPVSEGVGFDLVFLIDGTARSFSSQGPMIGQNAWLEPVEQLSRFAEALAEGTVGSRFSVLAFGDEPLSDTEAVDLKPFYVLHPPEEQRRFEPLEPSRVQNTLLTLKSTSGVDFVDALAEALQACRGLPWRERTRRIVLLCGDSPGHSILNPLRPGADARARRLDVDVEAEALHRAGIEIATLYFDPPANLGQAAFQRDLLDGARAQYARLASLPAQAFVLSSFDPDQAARALRSRDAVLGRGAALGELIGITVP